MTALDLIKLEVDRARAQYPSPLTPINFIGILTFKASSIIRHTNGHQLKVRPELKGEVSQLGIQIAALALRLVEDVCGGPDVDYYHRSNAISDEIKRYELSNHQ